MDLLSLIIVLLIVGVVLYFFPIDGTIKNIILCILVIAVILALFHGGSSHWNWSLR